MARRRAMKKMHFEGVLTLDGKAVDMEITACSDYQPGNSHLNGVHNGLVIISMQPGTACAFTFTFVYQSSGEPLESWASIPIFYFSVYDVDEETDGSGKEMVRVEQTVDEAVTVADSEV